MNESMKTRDRGNSFETVNKCKFVGKPHNLIKYFPQTSYKNDINLNETIHACQHTLSC